jgi:ATP-binding cassette subfamily B protein
VGRLLRTEPALAPAGSRATSTTPLVPRPAGRVAFEDVSFGYAGPGHDPELSDVSFSVEPGQTLAILGATGAGKSSLVQLIPRFYDASKGRVTIDGVDVRDIPEPELRKLVSIALQEAVLFSASIRENIALGRPDAGDQEILEVARIAQADEFVQRRPEGYETIVGQRGVNLSGGQKQRLAIARALLPWTPILILDDSTSAVDVATEARIQAELAEAARGQTRIVVAQRVSSAACADRILVLDDGRLVGDGTHQDLLASCPVYREIYESQAQSGASVHGQL